MDSRISFMIATTSTGAACGSAIAPPPGDPPGRTFATPAQPSGPARLSIVSQWVAGADRGLGWHSRCSRTDIIHGGPGFMRLPLTLFIFILTLGLAAGAGAAPAGGLSFVQATVVAPGPAGSTLQFVDASGRSRAHAVTGAAAPRIGRLRPGDEVIVVLSGAEPVVQDVRVSHAASAGAPETPATEAAAVAADESAWTVVPAPQMRPTWPNPYSRFYNGPKPAKGPRR